jgi:hypothetical protein
MKCRKCGSDLPAGAMFCAECGATVTAPKLVEPQTRTRPGDTAIIQPLDLNASAPEFLEPDFERVPATPAPVLRPAPVVPPVVQPVVAAPVSEPVAEPIVEPPVAELPVVAPAPPLAEPEPPAARIQTTPARPAQQPAPRPLQPPVVAPPAPAAPVSTFESQHDDVEATRIVRSRQGDRFVLQFSTGENSTVFGTGLIGRNPVMQPGEYVDQLVTIVDSGKSVSKTHLEFGQTAGVFWIIDRFSANGTVIRQPDVRPQRLDPGKRQTIARGTRVDIGEQFFVVS